MKFKLLLIALCLSYFPAFGQFGLESLKNKIEKKVEEKVEQKAEEAIDEATKSDEQKAEEEKKKIEAEEKKEEKNAPKNLQPEFKSFSKYDFIPGEKTLYFEDFSGDNVGEFPANWETNTSGEVVTTNLFPGKWFKLKVDGAFQLIPNITLPDNYTIEMDVLSTLEDAGCTEYGLQFGVYKFSDASTFGGLYPGESGYWIYLLSREISFRAYREFAQYVFDGNGSAGASIKTNKLNKVKVWVQKRRVRVYLENSKIIDLPTGIFPNPEYNKLSVATWGRCGDAMISNIRIATGLPDMRSKLMTEGKIVSYGLYFDTGSDKLKPESYGTLKSITDVLKENPDVKITIVGHTDSDGKPESNLDLSKRRAESVKSAIVKNFEIKAERIFTDGKGSSESIAPNDNAENKSKNRRVEFIKK